MDKINVLKAPLKPVSIPQNAQWLAGEGAGSWFSITAKNANFHIQRFSPNGKLECSGEFVLLGNSTFLLNSEYQFTYLSHCAQIRILQNNCIFKFLKKPIK